MVDSQSPCKTSGEGAPIANKHAMYRKFMLNCESKNIRIEYLDAQRNLLNAHKPMGIKTFCGYRSSN